MWGKGGWLYGVSIFYVGYHWVRIFQGSFLRFLDRLDESMILLRGRGGRV